MTKGIRTEAGSISHGTLRNEDLIAAFAGELRALNSNHEIVQEAEAVMLLIDLRWDFDEAKLSDLVCDLQDELNEHCSEDLYFGSHEGDGSDYGFWPVEQGNV